ncbi:extracellular solute-binding protein [Lentzea sp. NBRC 102530]|uniref:ABC transporter substrate-binding protein n=1 Tax=Lentzea sp. NBRC 102530 TaxID=3032201 RepID=UPI0024A0F834|nr:extracellular solute-binding protein [Lentzea sp. NBRC 102530]GLY51492.1 sugar ABC transporter substrate-binding protein [Lentzea sp. NBRC 102530]
MRKLWIALLALAAAACSGGATATGGDISGQTVEVFGPWTGDEQKNFEQVLQAFADRTGAEVRYTPAGDELPTLVQTRISGGTPPNIALVAQPGLVAQFAKAGSLKPLGADVEKAITEHNAGVWKRLGSVDGTLYGVTFKAANKSAFWYSEKAFRQVGATPPATWDDLIAVSKAIAETGLAPVSIGGADGWTLTDWFENVYLRTAGPDNYDKLAKHEIPWTDPTVRKALEELAKLWGDPTLIAPSALQTEFTKSVINVFGEPSSAAMVFEADFVASVITTNTRAEVGEDARFFPFPSVAGSEDAVVAGGDMAVQFKDDRATTELMKFLASPESGEIWAELGGFLSPNRNIPETSYPDEVTQDIARRIVDAGDNVRFDMSDLAPAAFGGTKGAGEWKDLQDFLADPKNVDGIMQRLEANAAKAYGK